MKTSIWFVCLVFLFIAGGCKQKSIEKDVSQMLGKKIQVPTSLQYIAPAEDRTHIEINTDKISNDKCKLIVYVDSFSCMSCAVSNIHDWDKYLKKVERFSDKLQIIFVFSPMKSEYNNLYTLLEIEKFHFPVWVDAANIFSTINSFIPNNPICHTFLTDKNNEVVLVGNPLKHKAIEDKIIEYLESW